MVKAYLRYEQEAVFGLVVSPSCGSICFDQSGRSILTGALERLLVWDVRKGTLLQQLAPQAGAGYSQGSGAGAAGGAAGSVHDAVPAVADVTAICPSPADATQVAAGYTYGTLRVWNMVDGTCRTSLAGHRSAVAVVRYNAAGALLASGGRDADIVVWDVAGEVGLVRLRGHRDQVTDLTFLEGTMVQHQSLLVSCSRDAQIKVWDLALHHCIQTIAEPRGELWTLAVHPSLPRLVAAGTEPEIHTIHADSSTRAASLQSAGHRSDVRSLALSSDGSLLLSVSKGSAKVGD
ncbi:unnamed protein product [Closterium sp. Yama58-4]|nr:unnamed protein product [Closterium sp. Yama58-4]